MEGVLFHEEQYLRSSKIMWIVLPAMILTIAGLVYLMVQQLVFDNPIGDDPMSDGALILVNGPSILLLIALVWLLWVSRLVTEIRDDGVYMQYAPLHRRLRGYKWSELADFHTRQYRPIREYGGWGLRIVSFGKGTAYNVSGNQGLQLIFNDGKKVLIGTQRRDELDEVLQQVKRD
jgi:hypothetical protein